MRPLLTERKQCQSVLKWPQSGTPTSEERFDHYIRFYIDLQKKPIIFFIVFCLAYWIMEVTGPAVKLDIHFSVYSLQSLLWIPKAPTGQRECITQKVLGYPWFQYDIPQNHTRGRCPGCILIQYPLDFF